MFGGTAQYNSPERIENTGNVSYEKDDPWALGVIAYYLCQGVLPFDGLITQIIHAIVNKEPAPIKDYSSELRDFIGTLLTKKPENRPTIQEIVKRPLIREAIFKLICEFSTEDPDFQKLIQGLDETDKEFRRDIMAYISKSVTDSVLKRFTVGNMMQPTTTVRIPEKGVVILFALVYKEFLFCYAGSSLYVYDISAGKDLRTPI